MSSSFAGSLENSLAPWGPLFRQSEQLRTLLELSDFVKKYCFKNPKHKDAELWDDDSFQYAVNRGRLFFLSYQGSDWASNNQSEQFRVNGVVDSGLLLHHWLQELNQIVLVTTWHPLHGDFLRLIEPWKDEIPGTQAIFAKVPRLGVSDVVLQGNHSIEEAERSAFSIQELAQFIGVYQDLRVTRAEAFAAELRGLADLYEAHPTRLKMPFAPQTHRPNHQHIPNKMRQEARIMEKRAKTTWWGYKEIFAYRFAYSFPALVVYDWTVELFRTVMQKHVCLGSKHLEAIVEKTKPVLDGIPRWAPCLSGHLQNDQSASVSGAMNPLDTKPHGDSARNEYHPRPDGELKWLASFVEVIAWMEAEFPDILQDVRSGD